jgi:hypothetical protein
MIELVYFQGCPNVDRARDALRAALGDLGQPARWTEWDQESPEAPARVQGYGSPTVLVNGRDVRGSEPGGAGRSCRADGPPSVDDIRRALARPESGAADEV